MGSLNFTHTFNVSKNLILNSLRNKDIDVICMFVQVKAMFVSSAMNFKNQSDLLKKLNISHSKFFEIKNNPLFSTLFTLTTNQLVAKNYDVVGVALTFSTSKKIAQKDRPFVYLDKKKLFNRKYIKQQIKLAVLQNFIQVQESHSHKENRGSTHQDTSKDVYGERGIYTGLSYERIADILNVSISGAVSLVKKAVEQKLIKKEVRKKVVYYGNDADLYTQQVTRTSFVKGKIFRKGKTVIHQISNVYTLPIENPKNKIVKKGRFLKRDKFSYINVYRPDIDHDGVIDEFQDETYATYVHSSQPTQTPPAEKPNKNRVEEWYKSVENSWSIDKKISIERSYMYYMEDQLICSRNEWKLFKTICDIKKKAKLRCKISGQKYSIKDFDTWVEWYKEDHEDDDTLVGLNYDIMIYNTISVLYSGDERSYK